MAEEVQERMGWRPGTPERPPVLRGKTVRIRTGHGNMFVTLNSDDMGRPVEVFIALGKAGSCDRAYLEGISRLASLALRLGASPEEVAEQLRGITCCPLVGQETVKSPVDGVAKVLLDGHR